MKETTKTTKTKSRKPNPASMNGSAATMTPNEKISEALNLVNEAKNEKIETTKATLNETYSNGMDRARDLSQQAQEKLKESKVKTFERMRETREDAETRIKEKPFQYLLGAGLFGILLGFLFGMKRK